MNGDWMGRMINVKITSAGKHFLMCEVVGQGVISQENGKPQGISKVNFHSHFFSSGYLSKQCTQFNFIEFKVLKCFEL